MQPRLDMEGEAVMAGHVTVLYVEVRRGGQGGFRSVAASFGVAVKAKRFGARQRLVRRGKAVNARRVLAWRGGIWPGGRGTSGYGVAGIGGLGKPRHVVIWWRVSRHGGYGVSFCGGASFGPAGRGQPTVNE